MVLASSVPPVMHEIRSGAPSLRPNIVVDVSTSSRSISGRAQLTKRYPPDSLTTPARITASYGIRYFFKPGVRRQLEEEIREQFRLFAQTGLALDHANAQNHMHVHPTILSLIVKVGREFGLRAIRIPNEPFGPAWRATHTHFGSRFAQSVFLS